MKFSLITVCLNSESTIADTIKSVIEQDHVDHEHIIFDGGSTDQTVEILKSFGDQIKLIRGSDSGIFDAMNQAIGYVSGDIVGIINSDDFYAHTQVLSRVVQQFELTQSDSVYGDLDYVYHDNPSKIYRNWKSGEFGRRQFKYGWALPHPTFFVKREIYNRYGMFDADFKISGDYELILRLLYKNRVSTSYLPEVLVKMRNNGKSNGSIDKKIQSIKEDYLAWQKNGLKPFLLTIPMKPLRKIPQFINARLNRPLLKLSVDSKHQMKEELVSPKL